MPEPYAEYVYVPRAVIESVMQVRDSILPDDDPNVWKAPLLGAIDSLRGYLTEGE